MKVEVEVISTEAIKPSSPTPVHLRNYKLSFLDQITPPVYMPLVLFYAAGPFTCAAAVYGKLKESLSDALTRFYPLAGRLNGNTFIDCNDDGAVYRTSVVKCRLSDVVREVDAGELNKFLPRELDAVDDGVLLAVQVNVFDCGGIAVGLCFSHKAADAFSLIMFLTAWAATSSGGGGNAVRPEFESAALFPPRDLSGFRPRTGIIKENIVVKRFEFRAAMVEALREKFAEETLSSSPTRVEALSAFIWTRLMAATGDESGPNRVCSLLHPVNLRPRMEPPLSESSFGNYYRVAITAPYMNTGEEQSSGLVGQIRETVKKIDGDYVRRLREGEEHLNFIKDRAERFMRGEAVSLSFTSLCRLPIYEADFGWGKPVWVGSAKMTFKNLVSFFDTKNGNGIEVWINLKDEDMAKLERDDEFLAFVSA